MSNEHAADAYRGHDQVDHEGLNEQEPYSQLASHDVFLSHFVLKDINTFLLVDPAGFLAGSTNAIADDLPSPHLDDRRLSTLKTSSSRGHSGRS